MKLDLTDLLYVMSFALDRVEAELLGLDTGHCRRVAYLSLLMAKEAGLKDEELRDFAGCCLLHDNALTEFIHEELVTNVEVVPLADMDKNVEDMMYLHHSIIGEKNIRLLPFRTDVRNIIQYHHENADGTGSLKKDASQTSLKSQILHLADMMDITTRLMGMTRPQFEELQRWVKDNEGTKFSSRAVELFFSAIKYEDIEFMSKDNARSIFRGRLKSAPQEYSDDEVHHIADFFAGIVDYKSEFTQYHSKGVADKAELMALYYDFDAEKTIRFYFAGAMHDIGKLMISNDILEKPGKLTADEFAKMKNHASATYGVLSHISGIPDIVSWASNHHEKLNGTGYPRGLTGEQLSFEDQLLACIDIYQALTEKRPYKDGMSHEAAISIMHEMVERGELNGQIVRDMDAVMKRG